MDPPAEIVRILAAVGQDHLLENFPSLSKSEKEILVSQLLEHLSHMQHYNKIFADSMNELSSGPLHIAPPDSSDLVVPSPQLWSRYAEVGMELVRDGKCAVLIMAGGSGTRLGISFPKGILVPPTRLGKSLYQIHCEKIRRVQELSHCNGKMIHLVLMLSEQTRDVSLQLFEDEDYFGLKREQVHHFVQSSMPCFTEEGKIVLADPCNIATAPGGTGGIYSGLKNSGVLQKLMEFNVELVQIFTVDNLLAKIGDPSFFGYSHSESVDVAVKAVPKISDHEAVGVFAKRRGKWGVVEYSEIGIEASTARNEKGERMFDCANIAIHLCSIKFLEKAANLMESYTHYHVAKKKIPSSPKMVKDLHPSFQISNVLSPTIAGVKLEAFIFDIFEFSERLRIIMVDRLEEFSAIKNAEDGAKRDTPVTATVDLHRLHTKWMHNAVRQSGSTDLGLILERVLLGSPLEVEISPLVSYNGEGLEAFVGEYLEAAARPHGPQDVFVVDVPRSTKL